MSIIITITSNITVCQGVNYMAFPLAPPPPIRFSPGLLFVVLQEILYQLSFAMIRLLQKKCIFKIKQSFSFNLLLAGFGFSAFCVAMFLSQRFFTVLPS